MNTNDMPTKAQASYLYNAEDAVRFGGVDVAFRLDGPGTQGTGEACLRRKWVEPVGILKYWMWSWPAFVVTPAGRAALERYGKAHGG